MCDDMNPSLHRPDLLAYRLGSIGTPTTLRTVMLSACSYTFLGIECTLQLGHVGLWVNRAEEYRLVLKGIVLWTTVL